MINGSGETATDVSAFFKSRKGLEKQFGKFWKTASESRRKSFEKAIGEFKVVLDELS